MNDDDQALRQALRKAESERDAARAQLARYRKALVEALRNQTTTVTARAARRAHAMAGVGDPLDTRAHDPLAGA